MTRLPASPRKIVAGLKLYARNPSSAPARARGAIAAPGSAPTSAAHASHAQRDHADSRGKPVEAIGEIDGVGYEHDPHHGEGWVEQCKDATHSRRVEKRETEAARNGQNRGQHLA